MYSWLRAQVRRYEKERVENKSTYWLLFELIWRDYFRFISIKFGDKLFKLGGLRDVSNLRISITPADDEIVTARILLTHCNFESAEGACVDQAR